MPLMLCALLSYLTYIPACTLFHAHTKTFLACLDWSTISFSLSSFLLKLPQALSWFQCWPTFSLGVFVLRSTSASDRQPVRAKTCARCGAALKLEPSIRSHCEFRSQASRHDDYKWLRPLATAELTGVRGATAPLTAMLAEQCSGLRCVQKATGEDWFCFNASLARNATPMFSDKATRSPPPLPSPPLPLSLSCLPNCYQRWSELNCTCFVSEVRRFTPSFQANH